MLCSSSGVCAPQVCKATKKSCYTVNLKIFTAQERTPSAINPSTDPFSDTCTMSQTFHRISTSPFSATVKRWTTSPSNQPNRGAAPKNQWQEIAPSPRVLHDCIPFARARAKMVGEFADEHTKWMADISTIEPDPCEQSCYSRNSKRNLRAVWRLERRKSIVVTRLGRQLNIAGWLKWYRCK